MLNVVLYVIFVVSAIGVWHDASYVRFRAMNVQKAWIWQTKGSLWACYLINDRNLYVVCGVKYSAAIWHFFVTNNGNFCTTMSLIETAWKYNVCICKIICRQEDDWTVGQWTYHGQVVEPSGSRWFQLLLTSEVRRFSGLWKWVDSVDYRHGKRKRWDPRSNDSP